MLGNQLATGNCMFPPSPPVSEYSHPHCFPAVGHFSTSWPRYCFVCCCLFVSKVALRFDRKWGHGPPLSNEHKGKSDNWVKLCYMFFRAV